MPNDQMDWYGTPVSSSTPTGKIPWKSLAKGGWKIAQQNIKNYLNKKERIERYQERARQIRQGQQIENQRLADSSQTKRMRRMNVQNTLVTKSAMRSTGKVKVKKNKTVKVPPRLRKQIKQVLVGETARGTYVTVKQGFVGSLIKAAIGTISSNDMANTAQVSVYHNQVAGLPGRTWFNQLVPFSPSAAVTAGISQTDMNYFTPAKILDAASVLFNKKALGNPYLSTTNLSSTFVSATGAPSAFTGKLKINVLNSFVQFTMKNVSNRIVTVEIYECTPTLKFQNINALAAMYQLYQDLSTGATDTNIEYYFNSALSNHAAFDATMEAPELAKKFLGYKFNWRKRTHILQPDETCVHSIQGPKGVLDFSKIISAVADDDFDGAVSESNVNALYKGWSVSCMISVNGDLVLPATTSNGGHLQYSAAVGHLGMPVSIEVKEAYKVAVPEVAGFIKNAAATGGQQMLNLRRPKFIYWNQSQAANPGYTISNELNPVQEGQLNAQAS